MSKTRMKVFLCLVSTLLGLLLGSSGCCPPCGRSIGELPAEYQAVLDGAVSDSGVPGGVMGVFCKDFWAVGASGLASIEEQTPMTADTHMRLASMTLSPS